jgi:hypothetical protein
MWGPRETGARLVVTWGRKIARPICRDGLGRSAVEMGWLKGIRPAKVFPF